MRPPFKFSGIFFLTVFLFSNCTKETIHPSKNPPVAHAGISQIIQLPTNTATLTGSGTTENFKITGYLWSLISGPNVPEVAGPSSATTAVSGFIAGNYTFQLMVIDSAGLTDVDTVSWVVKPALQQTITLKPANNSNEGHVNSLHNVGNSGDTELPIGSWTISGARIDWRELLKFDLSQIPTNATILNATLYLYAMPNPHGGDQVNAHSGPANACFVERVINNWTFTGMTWDNQPATTVVNRAIIPQSTSGFQDEVIDVKAMLQDMITNGNYGFKIRLQSEVIYNTRQYASSYHSNATLHPKLVITYK